MAKSKRRVISFELPDRIHAALQEDAENRGLESVHQRAREIIVEYFSNSPILQLHERLDSVDAEVHQVGEWVRRVAFSVIAIAAGKDSKDANEWIRENMPRTK